MNEDYRNHLRTGNLVFFLDYYSYCCIELNCKKAKSEMKENDNSGEEGWRALFLHYIDVLEALYKENPEAQYIVPIDYLKHLRWMSDNTKLSTKYCTIKHEIPTIESFKDLVDNLVEVSSYLKAIMENCYDLTIDSAQLEKDILDIERTRTRDYESKNRGLNKTIYS